MKLRSTALIAAAMGLAALGFASHVHILEEAVTRDLALKDLEFDILAVTLTEPVVQTPGAYEGFPATRVRIDEVLRGQGKAGKNVTAVFKALTLAPVETLALNGHSSPMLKPTDLVRGDKVIVCVQRGDPLIVNQGSVYRYNSLARYRVLENMKKPPSLLKNIFPPVIIIALFAGGFFLYSRSGEKKITPGKSA